MQRLLNRSVVMAARFACHTSDRSARRTICGEAGVRASLWTKCGHSTTCRAGNSPGKSGASRARSRPGSTGVTRYPVTSTGPGRPARGVASGRSGDGLTLEGVEERDAGALALQGLLDLANLGGVGEEVQEQQEQGGGCPDGVGEQAALADRKSTRLNSSH